MLTIEERELIGEVKTREEAMERLDMLYKNTMELNKNEMEREMAASLISKIQNKLETMTQSDFENELKNKDVLD